MNGKAKIKKEFAPSGAILLSSVFPRVWQKTQKTGKKEGKNHQMNLNGAFASSGRAKTTQTELSPAAEEPKQPKRSFRQQRKSQMNPNGAFANSGRAKTTPTELSPTAEEPKQPLTKESQTMAIKFNSLNISKLRNDAHFQFHTEFKDALGKMADATAIGQIAPQWAKYQELYAIEDEGLKKIRKSHLTEQIQNADKLRDETFLGMVEQNNTLLKHFNTTKREAAGRLKILFDTYGNVATKSLNEETSAIYNILQDLNGSKYQADTATAGLTDWATELQTRNTAFDTLVKQRDAETADKTDINLKQARANLDEVYDTITDLTEAHILLQTAEGAVLTPLVNAFNPVIDRYTKLLNAGRKGKGGGEGEEPQEG